MYWTMRRSRSRALVILISHATPRTRVREGRPGSLARANRAVLLILCVLLECPIKNIAIRHLPSIRPCAFYKALCLLWGSNPGPTAYKAGALPLRQEGYTPLVGIEPTTSRLEVECAIQLRQRGFVCPLAKAKANMRPSGIEPELQPWKSCILPLNYKRSEGLGVVPTQIEGLNL